MEDGDEAMVVCGGGVMGKGAGSGGAMGHLYCPHHIRLMAPESGQLEQVLTLACAAIFILLFIVDEVE